MATGTPVIAYARGSMPEIIDSGRTGFLVENLDQAEQVLSRIDEIDPRECRREVELRFSSDRMVDDYVRLYERIHRGRQ